MTSAAQRHALKCVVAGTVLALVQIGVQFGPIVVIIAVPFALYSTVPATAFALWAADPAARFIARRHSAVACVGGATYGVATLVAAVAPVVAVWGLAGACFVVAHGLVVAAGLGVFFAHLVQREALR